MTIKIDPYKKLEKSIKNEYLTDVLKKKSPLQELREEAAKEAAKRLKQIDAGEMSKALKASTTSEISESIAAQIKKIK